MINVKSFNMHTFLLKMHPSDISDSEKETEKKLMSINAAHQQFNKIVL